MALPDGVFGKVLTRGDLVVNLANVFTAHLVSREIESARRHAAAGVPYAVEADAERLDLVLYSVSGARHTLTFENEEDARVALYKIQQAMAS